MVEVSARRSPKEGSQVQGAIDPTPQHEWCGVVGRLDANGSRTRSEAEV